MTSKEKEGLGIFVCILIVLAISFCSSGGEEAESEIDKIDREVQKSIRESERKGQELDRQIQKYLNN